MGQDIILDIDDDVLERLERRAAAARKSLEDFLCEALTEAAQPGPGERIRQDRDSE
jgi:plasmid stability protein